MQHTLKSNNANKQATRLSLEYIIKYYYVRGKTRACCIYMRYFGNYISHNIRNLCSNGLQYDVIVLHAANRIAVIPSLTIGSTKHVNSFTYVQKAKLEFYSENFCLLCYFANV